MYLFCSCFFFIATHLLVNWYWHKNNSVVTTWLNMTSTVEIDAYFFLLSLSIIHKHANPNENARKLNNDINKITFLFFFFIYFSLCRLVKETVNLDKCRQSSIIKIKISHFIQSRNIGDGCFDYDERNSKSMRTKSKFENCDLI